MKEYKNLKEFYPFYLGEHSHPINKALHFVGTFIILCMLGYFAYTQNWKYLWLVPLFGYGFAWIGHFVFEKNKPATFKYPFLSFISDFKMFFDILTRKVKF